jgi:hypothetical protein
MSSIRIETLSVGSSTGWYSPDFSSIGNLENTCRKKDSTHIVPGIDENTYIFKRFGKKFFEESILQSQEHPSGHLWFSTPKMWRKGDPWEAAIVPEFFSLHPADGRADTACCSWSLCPDSGGQSADLGSMELFRQYAGCDGCIVAATLGNVLRALTTETITPEARVILWLDELVEAKAKNPHLGSDGGNPAYTGWPLVYKRRVPYAPEREIRFVLKNRDGTYLKIPTSLEEGEKEKLQKQHFGWPSLEGTLYAIEEGSYRDLIKNRGRQLSFAPLEGSLWGRHPEARDPAESTEQPAPLTPDPCSGRTS